MNLRKHPEAESLLRAAYEKSPRARAVVAQLSRICAINGKLDEAIELGRKSITLFPIPARPQRLTILATLYDMAGREEEALAARAEAARLAQA